MIFEGHVPISDIQRLLKLRPAGVKGLAVAGYLWGRREWKFRAYQPSDTTSSPSVAAGRGSMQDIEGRSGQQIFYLRVKIPVQLLVLLGLQCNDGVFLIATFRRRVSGC
jgi:hypothetical protein